MVKSNPFNLMFGKLPQSLVERTKQYQEIMEIFDSINPPTYAYIITGIRGSGKTVMLRSIEKELSNKKDWVVVNANPQSELIEQISQKLLYEGNKNKLFLDWSLSINAKFLSLEIKKKEIINNSEVILEKIIRKLKSDNKKILITIDEACPTKEMKIFANAYQSLIGKNLEIYLLMTGLKHNIAALVNSNASSFLSRTPKIELLPLDEKEIANEYQRIFDISFEEAASFSKLTKGYAFAYQVLGYLLFTSEDKKITDSLLNQYDRYLRLNGYDVIWNELTSLEKKICYALTELNNDTTNLYQKVGLKESNFQNYRSRLIDKDIIKSVGYGKVDFTLPRFKEFVNSMKYFE